MARFFRVCWAVALITHDTGTVYRRKPGRRNFLCCQRNAFLLDLARRGHIRAYALGPKTGSVKVLGVPPSLGTSRLLSPMRTEMRPKHQIWAQKNRLRSHLAVPALKRGAMCPISEGSLKKVKPQGKETTWGAQDNRSETRRKIFRAQRRSHRTCPAASPKTGTHGAKWDVPSGSGCGSRTPLPSPLRVIPFLAGITLASISGN